MKNNLKHKKKEIKKTKPYDLIDDLVVSFQVIANIIAKNPPMLLILGALILVISGAPLLAVSATSSVGNTMLSWAVGFFIAGIVLQVLWLFRHQIGRGI